MDFSIPASAHSFSTGSVIARVIKIYQCLAMLTNTAANQRSKREFHIWEGKTRFVDLNKWLGIGNGEMERVKSMIEIENIIYQTSSLTLDSSKNGVIYCTQWK